MPERDRDQSVEHLLRQVLKEAPAPASPAECLDGETMAAWSGGTLARTELEAIERHVAGCGRCQALAAAFIRTAPEPPATERIWQRFGLPWLVPLATAATAAALWFAIPTGTPPAVQPLSEERAAMAPSERADVPVAREADAARDRESVPAPPPASPPAAVQPRDDRAESGARSLASNERDEAAGALAKSADSVRAEAPAVRSTAAFAAPEATAERVGAAGRLSARQVAGSIEIRHPESSTRWRIIAGRQVEWSTTGTEWDAVALTPADDLTAGSSPSAEVCWVVGRRGLVYVTANATQFTRVSFPEAVDLSSVTATDARNARVTAADGRSWTTSNQGATWTPN